MTKPQNKSLVDVTFIDGEMKTYLITAAPTVSQYLAKTAGETGILVLFNDEISSSIPMTQIREYVIRPAPEQPE